MRDLICRWLHGAYHAKNPWGYLWLNDKWNPIDAATIPGPWRTVWNCRCRRCGRRWQEHTRPFGDP
jgi:hypothetical protein